jgi:hypothetical protein
MGNSVQSTPNTLNPKIFCLIGRGKIRRNNISFIVSCNIINKQVGCDGACNPSTG